jgi:hypothetical protein
MQGFNIQVNFLESGIDLKVNGKPVTTDDIQEFLTMISTKTVETSQKAATQANEDFVNIYDKIGEEVEQVADKTLSDFYKVFEGFDPFFGTSINLNNPFETNQLRKAQDTVKQWSDQASKLTDKAKAVANNTTSEPIANFGVQKLEGDAKYTIAELGELKLIPGFFDDQQYHLFKYFYGSTELDRKTFMNKIFNNLKPQ